MKKLTTRGYETAKAIANRESFNTHGALRANRELFCPPRGWMSMATHDLMRSHMKVDDPERPNTYRALYVVYSYNTVIAWWTTEHGWYAVDEKFSRTTSKHQGMLYLISAEKYVRNGIVSDSRA